jgi:hypothetical protein
MVKYMSNPRRDITLPRRTPGRYVLETFGGVGSNDTRTVKHQYHLKAFTSPLIILRICSKCLNESWRMKYVTAVENRKRLRETWRRSWQGIMSVLVGILAFEEVVKEYLFHGKFVVANHHSSYARTRVSTN